MNFISLFENIQGVQATTTTVGFNVCGYAGADDAQVSKDRAILADFFGVTVDDIYIPVQTHSDNVAVPGDDLYSVDAMVCASKGKVIGVNTADCLPLILADVDAGVIAAVHCGWRGTVAQIAAKAVQKMFLFGATPENIVAAMGPCIGSECFEVGEEVASQFPNEAVIRTYPKPHVDLAKAVSMQLVSLGVPYSNIAAPISCSMCDSHFHSVRREGRALPFRTFTAIKLIK